MLLVATLFTTVSAAETVLNNEQVIDDWEILIGANSVAVSPDGRNVYVAAGGEDESDEGRNVVYWDRDPDTGALINQRIFHDNDNLFLANSVTVSPDGRNVYAAADNNARSEDESRVVYWDRDPETGALTNQQVIQDLDLYRVNSVTVSPDNRNVYTSACWKVIYWDRNKTTGVLTNKQVIQDDDNLDYASSVTVSSDGRNVYAAAGGSTSRIVYWDRHKKTGALTNQRVIQQEGHGIPCDFTVTSDGRNVYVACWNDQGVVFWDRDPDTGALTKQQQVIQQQHNYVPDSVTVSPDGRNMYGADGPGDRVVYWDRDPDTGVLTKQQVIDDKNLYQATSITVSPDGRNVYATSGGTVYGTVVYWDRIHTVSTTLVVVASIAVAVAVVVVVVVVVIVVVRCTKKSNTDADVQSMYDYASLPDNNANSSTSVSHLPSPSAPSPQHPTSVSHFPARVMDCAAVVSPNTSPVYGILVTALSPLAVAMQHIESVIGSQVVQTAVRSAINFASHTSLGTVDGLTPDMRAAINVYTQEGVVYRPLNDALRNKNRALLKPYFPFLKLLLTALDQLPNVVATVHRGVKLGLGDQYHIGKTVTWWAFSSCTRDGTTLQSDNFCGARGQRTLFTVRTESAKDISPYSRFVCSFVCMYVCMYVCTLLQVSRRGGGPAATWHRTARGF